MKNCEPYTYLNHYECPECGEQWSDEWSCACDDRCPNCRTSVEPYQSDDIEPSEDDCVTE